MKITITTLKNCWDSDVQNIYDVLGKKTEVKKGKAIPSEAGGGVWIPYGLAIFLGATGIVAKKFLEELGKDLYKKLKKAILKHLEKEDVYILLEGYSKMIGFKITQKETRGGVKKIGKSISKAIDIFPKSLKKKDNEIKKLLKISHNDVYLIMYEYDEKSKGWSVVNLYSIPSI